MPPRRRRPNQRVERTAAHRAERQIVLQPRQPVPPGVVGDQVEGRKGAIVIGPDVGQLVFDARRRWTSIALKRASRSSSQSVATVG